MHALLLTDKKMKDKNLNPLAISLSIVALGLSVYSVYTSGGLDFLKTEDPKAMETPADEFSQKVYKAIDQYIADKQAEAQKAAQPQGPIDVSADDDAMKGEKNAPVTIVEFTDYQCPYCERYFADTYSQILKNYIETGKVKYIVRDFPLPFHQNAASAANAAECVRDQKGDEAYFEYHDMLFSHQNELSTENYKLWADDLGVDAEAFATCVDENQFADEVEADMQEGSNYGVQGTPAFFINGMPISGAQPYSVFEQLIEKELKK